MWNGETKVITGIRRCGKSVLLFDLFYEYLLGQGVDKEQIIKLELDQRKNEEYRDPIKFCDYVESIVSGHEDEKCKMPGVSRHFLRSKGKRTSCAATKFFRFFHKFSLTKITADNTTGNNRI